jgi:hypothetical protein
MNLKSQNNGFKKYNISDKSIFFILFVFFVIPVNFIIPQTALYFLSFFFFFLIFAYYNKVSLMRYEHIFLVLLLLVSFFALIISSNNIFFDFIYYFIIIVYLNLSNNNKVSYSESDLRPILYFAIVSILIQLSLGSESGRIVLSISDPNFSGLFLLLFFFFSNSINSRIGVIFSVIAGLMLLSRNFFFSIILFYLIRIIKIFFPRFFSSRLIAPTNILIFSVFFIIFLSNFWILNIIVENDYIETFFRLFSGFFDSSNFGRFNANISSINFYFFNFPSSIFGYSNIDVNFNILGLRVLPHNSFLYSLISNGLLFSILGLFLVFRYFDRLFSIKNVEFFATYIFFSMFLHGLYSGIFLLIFSLIVQLKFNLNN